jgi:hypothetical protein
MRDEDIVRVNAAGALDVAVEAATPNRLVVIGFVDDPSSLRFRIVFDEPLYVQIPWRLAGCAVERRSIRDLLEAAPAHQRWELPERKPVPPELPSLSFDDLREAGEEGAALVTFVSRDATPSDPPSFILARRVTVVIPSEAG